MNPAEFEKLVEAIVDEVVAALQESKQNPANPVANPVASDLTFDKRLLTEADALRIVRKGKRKLLVAKNTIITPLANDHLGDSRIKIIRMETLEKPACGCQKEAAKTRNIALLAYKPFPPLYWRFRIYFNLMVHFSFLTVHYIVYAYLIAASLQFTLCYTYCIKYSFYWRK